MVNKISIFFVIALVVILLSFRWNTSAPDSHTHEEDHSSHELVEMDENKANLHGIHTKKSGPGVIKTSFTTRGKVIIHPDRKAEILPQVSGIVKEVRKNRGDLVSQGEVVAVLESKEIADEKAHYLAALEREKLATQSFSREAPLYSKGISSEEEYLNAKHALEEAKINLKHARQKLFAFGLSEQGINALETENDEDIRLYEVRSPLGGVVISRHLTKGAHVDERVPIYEIADLSSLLVEIGIYPKDLEKVQENQIVEVKCQNFSCSQEAKIIYISPLIDEDTITAKAFAELDNRNKLWKAGTFVTVVVNTSASLLPVVISKESIQTMDGETVVFVQTKEGFIKRSVEIGKQDDQNAEIVKGLEPGIDYAASQVFLLKADLGKDSIEHED